MSGVTLGHLPFSIAGMAYYGLPNNDAFLFVIVGALLHCGYQIFLMNAYRFGDLSQVYPIARGLSPLLLTLATLILGQDFLSSGDIFGIILVSSALMIFGFRQLRFGNGGGKALVLSIMTGLFIASYSMVDALGTRITGDAISYYSAMSFVNAGMMIMYFGVWHRASLTSLPKTGKMIFLVGGGASYAAYIIVLWACLFAPVAVVSSLRETSVLFAVILGVVILKEKLSPVQVIATIVLISGVMIMRLA